MTNQLLGQVIFDFMPIVVAQTSFLTSFGQNLWLAFQVALGLGFVIFVHELGHFLAAKTFGVRCDKFYVGFDPPISIGPIQLPRHLGKFQWGETEYGIGIIPLGGYVKMLGQDDDPRRFEEEAANARGGEEDAPLDPRSYPAKPVWQRMIIISAGVVMNLIFAVIMAACAFWMGVPYTPTIAGASYAGGPAWESGIQPGDRVLRVGDMSSDLREFRYDDFLGEVVSHGLDHGPDDLKIAVQRGSDRIELITNPSPRYHPKGFHLIGLRSPRGPTLAAEIPEDSFLASKKPDLQPGDRFVAVDGIELPKDPEFGLVLGSELTKRFQAKWEEPVSVTVERPAKTEEGTPTTHEVEFPPVPVKWLGLGFAVGPISAIQHNSLAEAAGLQVGDTIVELNGERVENALLLPSLVGRLAGESITFKVQRGQAEDGSAGDGGSQLIEITIDEAPPASFDTIAFRSGELSLAGLGAAYTALPAVSSVGDEATGIQVGDELMQVQWIVSDEERKELKSFSDGFFEPIVIDKIHPVAYVYDLLQSTPVGSKWKCIFRREGKVQESTTLTTAYAEDWFWHQRGVPLPELKDTHYAKSFADAMSLGLWETTRKFKSILNFLRLLVTGRVGTNGLAGPLQIASFAAAEADNGPSRLLIFLTMLSANLAILNFLPIPALDGGHMVFLTAEAIMGRPVNEELQMRLTMVGVLGLLCLMAFVIVKDILAFTT